METLLLVGRWNGITRDQETTLRRRILDSAPRRTFFVISGSDQSGTKRYPLSADERQEIVKAFAEKVGRYYELFRVTDIPDSSKWVEHIANAVSTASQGRTKIDPLDTTVMSGNPDVLEPFAAAGYTAIRLEFSGAAPTDLIGAMVAKRSWASLANEATTRLYQAQGIEQRVATIFGDVYLTEEGELSTGRDFAVYAGAMDASVDAKLHDLLPHVKPGRIVDKGCGTGKLLLALSDRFPTSKIFGIDLSRELLRVADGRHYPNQNVTIVKGNIIHRHFPAGSVDTMIFSSVIHEIYSYGGYSKDVVRLALKNTWNEMTNGGRLLIRDGVRPPDRRVWMRCDGDTEARFRRFAKEFKGTGFPFEEREIRKTPWFRLGLHEANEFLSKKDYSENWMIEVKEEFGVFTRDEWKRELETLGFRVGVMKSYVNPWIEKNRYQGKAWLHADEDGSPGEETPYPDTTLFIGAEAV